MRRSQKTMTLLGLVVAIVIGVTVPIYYLSQGWSSTPSVRQSCQQKSSIDNSNIVFYQNDDKDSQSGVKALKKKLSKKDITTIYVDINSSDGQRLASRVDVISPNTIVIVRDGAITLESYFSKQNNKIQINQQAIEKANREE